MSQDEIVLHQSFRATPERVAEAAARMNLRHAVITMVARDDLPDGGMTHVADTVRSVRRRNPGTVVETLVSDAKGDAASLQRLFDARPDVFNHNVETVARLQRAVRPSAGYARSLSVLARAKSAGLTTNELKLRALVAANVAGDPAGYEVKFRGALVLDETRTMGDLKVPAGAGLIVQQRRRQAVR